MTKRKPCASHAEWTLVDLPCGCQDMHYSCGCVDYEHDHTIGTADAKVTAPAVETAGRLVGHQPAPTPVGGEMTAGVNTNIAASGP